MASLSMPPPSLGASPFEGLSAPSSPTRHRRMPSRTPKVERLPAFSFNPGAETMQETPKSDENESAGEEAHEGSKRAPPPLPDFSFNPAANLPAEPELSPTHPVLQEMALNQQRVSRSARPAPLPAFTFGSATSSASPSPTRSTFPDMPGSAGLGHRRRGSEFVGGGKEGSQLVSTSPGKSDYRPPPVSAPPRGHMHRRSQAISVSDIDTSDLIKTAAVSKARAGSQPTTPSEPGFAMPRNSPPRHSSSLSQSMPSSPQRHDSMSGIRPRVGFADRVDVIPRPRPLSLISSETEGSCSTIRGHSLSGSINSIAYNTSALSSPTKPRVLDDSPPKVRPRTADPATLLSPVMSREEKEQSLSIPKRPLSASGSPSVTLSGSPPNKKKHFWFSPSLHSSPSPTPKAERGDPLTDIPMLQKPDAIEAPRPRTSPERGSSIKKKRKYHTWTSGIFSKKSGKRHTKNSKRTATPPTLVRRPSDKINEIFDADDTVVLREPSPVVQRARPKSNPLISTVPPFPTQLPLTPVEPIGPALDLDAAMADTSSLDTPTRGAAARIAKLHSSERRGQMDPFGAFHKRSESAPAMQPVNRASFAMQRMGSNQSLSEEVFDEEEEDNFLAGKNVESEDEVGKDSTNAAIGKRESTLEGLGLAVTTDDIVIVDPEDDLSVDPHRSSTATIEAPVIPEETKRPATSPMFFAYSAPHSHYASSTEGRTTSASMMSSPDAEHVSFESFPRNNRHFGDSTSEYVLRGSNEDLPSLSDSISSTALPRISSSANTRSSVEQRAQSVCIPGTSRSNQPAWKRASLASLNRLIPGSANGSNLKFETVATEPVAADDKEKRRSNRLSKLMKFWRTKEKVPTDG